MQKKLYVMISKTDTGVGKLIRQVTGFTYNHVSMTLDEGFRSWVSFARYIRNTPLYAGFLREPVERYLAKGERIEVQIFGIDISDLRYAQLQKLFSLAGTADSGLMYNLLGLVSASVGLDVPITGAYTCLGFANAVLGTKFKDIRALSRGLAPQLFYEGSLGELAPDSGSRDDLFFRDLDLWQSTVISLKAIGKLLQAAFTPNRTDPVTEILSKEGAHI